MGYVELGRVLVPLNCFIFWKKTRWKPDVCAYNSLVDGLCKSRMVDDTFRLLTKMTDMGISPNVITYSIRLVLNETFTI
ncbi:hypothetical protein ACS0TY_026265 [Phlomoides rotata]